MIRTLVVIAAALSAQAAWAQDRQEFPPADPESVGVPRAALERLDAVVRGYVERDEAVGAELMVIKDRKTVWHTAHGWADREAGRRLEPGAIMCIRSMTKPLVGTAVQMLVDDGLVALDDRVSKHLPAFDTDSHRAITVAHLLEHRGGLPLSSLLGIDHRTLKGVADVAALAAKADLEFEPGAAFSYSDDGADTLAALIEKVSGRPVEAFIRGRILEPLGMRDTLPLLTENDPHTPRLVAAYTGGRGEWGALWSPGQPPLFPYFLGSQGMYFTCEDYARLLCLWADGGRAGVPPKRLLSEAAVRRGLRPRSNRDFRSGFDGLRTWYAQLWIVAAPAADEAPDDPVVFGHGGSDGTLAWMWPGRDLIVLYFTQSRGGTTVVTIGREIDRLLIRGELDDPAPAAHDLASLAGIYWNDELGISWAMTPEGGKLRAELQGKSAADLVPGAGEHEWRFELQPATTITFLPGEDGRIDAFQVKRPDGSGRRWVRLDPAPDLPSAAVVAAKVRAAHGMDRLAGIVRREGTFEARGASGPIVSLLSPCCSRADMEVGGVKVRVLFKDGEVWMRRGGSPPERLEGRLAAAALLEQPHVLYGGWDAAGARATVIKRLEEPARALLLVRVAPPGGPGSILFIDDTTWRIVAMDRIVEVPGMNSIGQSTTFGDFAEAGGVLLPRSVAGTYASRMLGSTAITIERMETMETPGADPFSFEAP